jgi:D-glycero-alpha-D-manno-heptose-7-phosphate kinase
MTLSASAPTRIDFGGGWTDVSPYPEEMGGRVCNVAINRRATATLRALPGEELRVRGAAAGEAGEPLIRAAARRAGITGAEVGLHNDFPVGAGLGGSSAAGVALQALFSAFVGSGESRATLAELSRTVEIKELGIPGGRQDHYAAAVGGILDLTLTDTVSVRRIDLPASARTELVRRCLLLYTGESRISGHTITAVLDAYARRERVVLAALSRMASLASEMAEALEAGSVDSLAALVAEHWSQQRALHPRITTERIEAIFDRAARVGGVGGKALGASGGGCIIVFGRDADACDRIRAEVSDLATELRWEIDDTGVTVTSDS